MRLHGNWHGLLPSLRLHRMCELGRRQRGRWWRRHAVLAALPRWQAVGLQLLPPWQLAMLLPLPQQCQLSSQLWPLLLHLLLHCCRIKAAPSCGRCQALCRLNH